MKGRRMRFTLNNWTEEQKQSLLGDSKFSYVIVGEELAPTTGTRHLQGYAEFVKQSQFGPFGKKYHMACFKCDATTEKNIEYCKKDGIFEERGEPKKEGGQAEKDRWEDARKAAKEGRLDDLPADIYFRYYRTAKEIAKDHMPDLQDCDIDNYWIYGAAGVGKSRKAREMAGTDFYPKLYNKWWDGYQGQEWIILDDYELDGKMLGHFMKIWADRYPFNAETKGGMLRIRPKHIVVTSNYSPEAIFGSDDELLAAIKRRFKITKLV
jgi:hypothetical protein